MKKQSRLWTALTLAILCAGSLCLPGCQDPVKALGAGPWPKYPELPEAEFSAGEQAVLIRFATENPELYKKIHGRFLYYEAVVKKHNEAALKRDRELLGKLGYTDERIKEIAKDKE